jgi:hypothetical protein
VHAAMTIQIELTAEEEAQLRQQAAARGNAPEVLAGEMLRSFLRPPASGRAGELLPVVDEHGVFHQDRWDAVMASIARRSKGTPVLPAEALTREAMYQDHD